MSEKSREMQPMSDHEIQIQLSGLIQLLANNLYAVIWTSQDL
jgi:hypothetical protein